MEYEVSRDLIEAAFEGVTVEVCPGCGGEGSLPKGLHIECPRCKGRGQEVAVHIERGEQ